MYSPALNMYTPRNPLRCGLYDFAISRKNETSASSALCSLPGTRLKCGIAKIRSSAATTSSSPVTTQSEMTDGFTLMPRKAIWLSSCSTASFMTA